MRRRSVAEVENFAIFMGTLFVFAVLVVALVLAVIAIVKRMERTSIDPEKSLADRFARGEITEAEYARTFAILRFGPNLDDTVLAPTERELPPH